MGAETKSLGILIDDLITTSMKLWHLQEIYNRDVITDEELGQAFRKIQKLNVRRNAIMNAIDEISQLGLFSTTEKTYK